MSFSSKTSENVQKEAIPLKFENHRLIPQPVPDEIRPSNKVLQGRICDMAHHISEWSTEIIDSAKQNKEWMPVNVTAELLKSRLNMVLKAMDEYHTELVEPESVEEASSNTRITQKDVQSKKKHMEIPQPSLIQPQQLPFLDSNFASAVAYQQYYPYYYQPQQMRQPYMPNQQVQQVQQQQQVQPSASPSELSSQQISPVQMQQLYAQQQYAMQNPMFMMPTYQQPQEQHYMQQMQQMPQQQQYQQYMQQPPPPQDGNGESDFTKLLFEDLDEA